MDKLPMCRICLVEDVNMYVVVNKNLHELYEKLTDIPFVTKDSRPILACFFCCAKLKQCFRLLRKCLEAEELFAQMVNDDYKPLLSISQDHLHRCTGFIKSPIVHVSVVDECGTDSIAIKEELPAICERQDDVIEPNKEYRSDDLDLANLNNTCLGIEDIPPQLSESDSRGDVKMEGEQEQGLSKKKQQAVETNRLKGLVDECGTDSIAIKEELPAICDRRDDVIEQKEEYQTDDLDLGIEDIPPQLSESDSGGDVKMEVEQELYKKKRRAVEINRAPVSKKPKLDTRRTRLEDKITVGLKKNELSNLEVTRTTKNCTFKHGPSVKESYKCERSSNRVKKIKQYTRTGICEKLFHCDVCQCSFRRKEHLTVHIRIHTGEKPYKCDVCQRRFSNKGNVTAHIRMHTGEKPYKCDVCQRSFRHKGTLTTHIRMHTGEQPYKCDVCQRCFSQKSGLTAHIRMHTGDKGTSIQYTRTRICEKLFHCDVCQRSFRLKGNLTAHIRIHTGEKPYKCDVCQRSFSQTSHLKDHIRMHTGDKPYKCDVCQGRFSRKITLTEHIRVHTGEKPYKCDVCQRSFSRKSNLTAHIRMHTGKKLFHCDVCQLSFRLKSNLTTHIRMHTGENLYKCDVCQRCFSRKSHLTRHIRIHRVI